MAITVRFGRMGDDDGSFRRRLGGESGQVQVEATTVREILRELIARNPQAQILVDEKGELRRFMLVYVEEEDVRFLQGMDTPVAKDGNVFITSAICSLFYDLIEREFLT